MKTWKAINKMDFFSFKVCKVCSLKINQKGFIQSGKMCKCKKEEDE